MKRQPAFALMALLLLVGAKAGAAPESVPERDEGAHLLRQAAPFFGIPTRLTLGEHDGRSVAIGDWDGDGLADVVVKEFGSGEVWVFRGDGSGGFGSRTVVARSMQTVAGRADFDGDGVEDEAVTDTFGNAVALQLGNRTRRSGRLGAVLADFDQDGTADLATVDGATSGVNVLLGNERGQIRSRSRISLESAPSALAMADFNGDGFPDLVVASPRSDGVSVLLGDGRGEFSAAGHYPALERPSIVAVGDANGDGIPDVAVANRSHEVSILLGTGRGDLGPPATFALEASPQTPPDSDDYEGVAALTLSPTTIARRQRRHLDRARSRSTHRRPPAEWSSRSPAPISSWPPRCRSVTVPAGATSATFTVATNARYRRVQRAGVQRHDLRHASRQPEAPR